MIGEICKVTVLVGSYCSATWATCTVLVQTQARQGTHDRPGKDRAGVDRGHNVMMASPPDAVTFADKHRGSTGIRAYGKIIFRTGTAYTAK